MSDDQKKIIPIDYTSREFGSIRKDLLEIAERLYPDSFQDFSEGSFGAMMVDSVAYVADQLSFYLDYNVNETFLDTAYQYDNVLRHGRTMGYKYTGRPSTYGVATLFIIVPASATGIGPDRRYIPIMKRGSRFSSETGLNFMLTQNVDFADPKNSIIAARVDPSTGAPTYYAIKAYGHVVSGFLSREQIPVGAYERFKKLGLKNSNIAEIVSVFDAEGNEYYEVDYLSQDMIFREASNTNFKNDNVPSILKPFLVSRKFVVDRTKNSAILQFGSGKMGSTDVIADPAAVAMNVYGKTYITDLTFDPTRLSQNENYGVVPTHTTLDVVYRTSNPTNSNLAVGSLTSVGNAVFEFADAHRLTTSIMNEVRSSVEVNNEEPIIGDVRNATTDQIKRRIYDTFATQNRAVTQADYENLVYRMPARYGSVKRCSAQRDADSRKRNLNLYVISEDSFGKLTTSNRTIKNNLKTWLNQYRMMSDTIDIVDAYIINFGIDFIVTPAVGSDKFKVLDACVEQLKSKYDNPYYIGEKLSITDIYSELNKVKGVLDVVKVKIVNKTGGNYSAVEFNINQNISPDGTYVVVPKNALVELKYPSVDIKGKIR